MMLRIEKLMQSGDWAALEDYSRALELSLTTDEPTGGSLLEAYCNEAPVSWKGQECRIAHLEWLGEPGRIKTRLTLRSTTRNMAIRLT